MTAEQIEAYFRQVASRMAELPICHPELQVELVGWQVLADLQLGVLLTPWSSSLLVFAPDLEVRAKGEIWSPELPSGAIDCVVQQDEQLGGYASAALHARMQDFADQGVAREFAEEVLRLLLTPPAPVEPAGLSRRQLLRRLSGQGATAP